MKFKVGDIVVCTCDINEKYITAGQKFKVVDMFQGNTGHFLVTENLETGRLMNFYSHRFELVKEKKKAEVWTKKDIEENAKTQTFNIYPQKVIFNDKATILFYKCSFDYIPTERKIVTKCQEGDKFTKEDGLRICVLKAMKRELERELKQY